MAGNRKKQKPVERIAGALSSLGRTAWARRAWLAGAAVFVLSVVGIHKAAGHLSRTGRFSLRTVEVLGAVRFDPAEVEELCGLESGVTNVFTTDPRDVMHRCLEDDRIEWAEVTRLLPDRIRIRIREATPVVFAAAPEGVRAFDSMGRRYFGADPAWAPGLPLLTGLQDMMEPVLFVAPDDETPRQRKTRLARQDQADREHAERVGEVVAEAARLVASMDSSHPEWLSGGVMVEWDEALGFELRMPGRPVISFGFEGFDEKVARIDSVLAAASARDLDVEQIYLDDDESSSSGSLRWREKGTALTSVVTFE